MGFIVDWLLVHLCYLMRRLTHYMRMKQIAKGIDWRFYEDYSAKEIFDMKLDGSEESKYWAYTHKRR